jgi:hypothetical protein
MSSVNTESVISKPPEPKIRPKTAWGPSKTTIVGPVAGVKTSGKKPDYYDIITGIGTTSFELKK